jgi:hypothetical protein
LLADGTKITLDEAGVIVEIEAAEPAEPAPAPAPVAPVQMKDARVDVLQAEVNKLKDGFAQMVSLVEALTETPAVEPIEPQKTQFGAMAESKKDRLEKVAKLLTQIKNK